MKKRTFEHTKTTVRKGELYSELEPIKSESFRECIMHGLIEEIGKIRPKRSGVDLGADRKRFWLG